MSNIAVILFVYKRLEHTMKMVSSLMENRNLYEYDLYIFSDGPKTGNDLTKVNEVRKFITESNIDKKFHTCTISYSNNNKGLARSVIDGVSDVMKKHKKAIVIEDDNILSNDYLEYMKFYLDIFESNKKIFSIGGYNFISDMPNDYPYDIFFMQRTCSYNWGIWSDRWFSIDWNMTEYKKFKYNIFKRFMFNKFGNDRSTMLDFQEAGLINSWAIRTCYTQFITNTMTVYPTRTKSINIGNDGTGTHKTFLKNDVKLENDKTQLQYKLPNNISIDRRVLKLFKQNFHVNIFSRFKRFVKALIIRRGNSEKEST